MKVHTTKHQIDMADQSYQYHQAATSSALAVDDDAPVARYDAIKARTLLEIPPDMARDKIKEEYPRLLWYYIYGSFGMAVLEALLVSWTHGWSKYLQLLVLIISTFLFLFGVIVTASNYPTDEELSEIAPIENKSDGDDDLTSAEIRKNLRFRNMYMNKNFLQKCYLVIDVEIFVELFFGVIGWLFIFTPYSGISALRCFRIFRYMWYFELLEHEVDADYKPEDHFFSLTHATQLCLFYLEQVGLEFFTQKSKGAIVIISILAYITYVFAIVFSTDFSDVDGSGGCAGSLACGMTLLRMVMYDGNGLVITTQHMPYMNFLIYLTLYLIVPLINMSPFLHMLPLVGLSVASDINKTYHLLRSFGCLYDTICYHLTQWFDRCV